MNAFVAAAALLTLAVLVVLWLALRRAQPGAGGDEAGSNVRILRTQLAELRAEFDAGSIDMPTFDAAHAELERRVLVEAAPQGARAGKGLRGATLLLLCIPLIALVLYARLGNRQALDPAAVRPASAFTPQDVEAMVERLARRMQADPSDAQGWMLLARSYMAMQRFDAARDAYAQAAERRTGDAQLLADYADASAMAQGQSLQGEPQRLITQALQVDPDNLKALALAAAAALQRGEAQAAVAHFERALRVVPPDSPFAADLQDGLRQAQASVQASSNASAASSPRR